MPLPAEEFKVFISHATIEDGKLVKWISDALDRLHIRAYVYELYQIGGQNRFEVIKKMIEVCPYFLVVLTKDGIASQWVNQEIGYAVAKGKTPIPVLEVDSTTNRRYESKGFVELHDPILYDRNNDVQLMADIVYTFQNILSFEGKWRDLIFLSCKCGNDFDGQLGFREIWSKYINGPEQKPFMLSWTCEKCQRKVVISFPDCHLLSPID